jgi:hypothetical protein
MPTDRVVEYKVENLSEKEMMEFLAQITPPTSGAEGSSLDIVSESINLAKTTSESWDKVWISTIDPIASGLWVGLVSLGITLAAVSILFLTLSSGKDIIYRKAVMVRTGSTVRLAARHHAVPRR